MYAPSGVCLRPLARVPAPWEWSKGAREKLHHQFLFFMFWLQLTRLARNKVAVASSFLVPFHWVLQPRKTVFLTSLNDTHIFFTKIFSGHKLIGKKYKKHHAFNGDYFSHLLQGEEDDGANSPHQKLGTLTIFFPRIDLWPGNIFVNASVEEASNLNLYLCIDTHIKCMQHKLFPFGVIHVCVK